MGFERVTLTVTFHDHTMSNLMVVLDSKYVISY